MTPLRERTGHPAPPALAERRAAMAGAARAGAFAAQAGPRESAIAGRRCLVFAPPGVPRGRVVHFHGGGYRTGMPEAGARFAAALARRCAVEVILPEYRLAPEQPFPAALNDAAAVVEAIAEGLPLIASGDSAGGGLAAALGVLSAAGDVSRLAGVMLHSPVLDLTVTAPSYVRNAAADPLLCAATMHEIAALYLQGHDPRDPLASPVFALLAGFPPALLTVGEGEVLVDEARQFHRRLLDAGTRAALLAIPGMEHVALVRDAALAGAAECFAATCHFVVSTLSDDRHDHDPDTG